MKFPTVLAALLLAACGSATGGVPCASPLPADVAGGGQACSGSGRLAEMIKTDARSYSPGARIVITVTATNQSSGACAAPTACPPLPVAIYDSSGKQVWAPPQLGRPCPALVRLMSPGETVSYPVTVSGLTLGTGLYSVSGRTDQAAAYGRAYFTVC
jgi:hypothetical protein